MWKYWPSVSRLSRAVLMAVVRADRFADYLKLTGSEAFKPRLEASKLVGFFVVELGDTLNTVVHFWECVAACGRALFRR